jgi:hypothetical protein
VRRRRDRLDTGTKAQVIVVPAVVFGYLTVKVREAEVWTIGRLVGSRHVDARYLGPLAGAKAAMELDKFSVFGVGGVLKGIGPHLVGTVSITFADGTSYQRPLRWGALIDAPKIRDAIDRFNALAAAAAQNPAS